MKKYALLCAVLVFATVPTMVNAGKENKGITVSGQLLCVRLLDFTCGGGYVVGELNTEDGSYQTSIRCGTKVNNPKERCGRFLVVSNEELE